MRVLYLCLLAGCTPPEEEPPHERFTVVALPDTQKYAQDHPEVFYAQTAWIAEHRDELDIRFVTHLGDVVDNGPNERHWANARASFDLLDEAGVAWGVAMGNHDNMYSDGEYAYPPDVDHSCSDHTDIDCTAEHFRRHVGPEPMADVPAYGGSSPSGVSSWSSFEAGGHELLFLHLGIDARADEVTWAQEVLDAHPGAVVHLSTHRYLYDYRLVDIMPDPLPLLTGGRYNALVHSLHGQGLYYLDGTRADELFESFVAANPNIYMVQCGHVDAEYRQQSENVAGLQVYEILSDFQKFHPVGGNGWMKLLRYDLTEGTIEVRTYSPWIDEYRANGDGLDTSLQVLEDSLDWFADDLAEVGLDLDELEALVEHWTTTEEGRQEYFEAAYGDGQRDSEFTLEVDFAAYAGG